MRSDAPSKEEMIERAAARVSDDETFVASAMRDMSGGQLDFDVVTAFLDCSREVVARIALCRRPVTSAPSFRAEVAKIAAHAAVDEVRLLGLFREAASVAALP